MKEIRNKGYYFSMILLFLALILPVAGCQKKGPSTRQESGAGQAAGQTQDAAKGRYVETMLTMPDGYQGDGSLGILDDGSLLLLDVAGAAVHQSADGGKSWETRELELLRSVLNMESVEFHGMAVSGKGEIFVSYVSWIESEEGIPEHCIFIDEKGKKTKFELGVPFDADDSTAHIQYMANIQKAVFTTDGTLFALCDNGKIYEINPAKKKAAKKLDIDSAPEDWLFAFGESIAVILGNRGAAYNLSVYNPKTKETDADDTTLDDYITDVAQKDGFVVLGGNSTEKLWAASPEGLYTHVMKGSVMEQVAEGSLTSLSDPSIQAAEIHVVSEDMVYVLFESGELASYTYDPDVPTVPDRQLTVYSLYDNSTVRQAINVFRQGNSDIYVKLEIGMDGGDGVTESDAIRNLSTEILAGSGPDVLLLDGISLDSYMEKGILMDLTEKIEEWEKTNQYYGNILKAFGTEKGIYAVPVRFYLPLLLGEQGEIDKINDLESLAAAAESLAGEPSTKETVLGCYTAKEVLEHLYPVCMPAWKTDSGEVDSGAVREYLAQAKRIYQAEQKNLSQSEIDAYKEIKQNQSEADGNSDGFVAGLNGSRQVYRQLMGKQVMTAGVYGSMMDLMPLASALKKQKEQGYKLLPGQAEQVFLPSGVAGIAAGAKEKELAGEFLGVLLGEKVQGKDLGDGFPVNKDAFPAFSKCLKTKDIDAGIVISASGTGNISMELIWMSGQNLKRLEKIIETLETPVLYRGETRDSLVEIGVKALTDEKGVEESAEEICQRQQLLEDE